MNPFFMLLEQGVYPTQIKLTKQQAKEVIQSYTTSWISDAPSSWLELYAYCEVYYKTKTGKDKKCHLLWEIW